MKNKLTAVTALFFAICCVLVFTAVPVLATAPVTISVSAPSQAVNPGSTFNVSLLINNTVPVYGWQVDVTYDNTKLTYNSITEGTFLKSNGSTIAGGTPNTRVTGTIGAIAYSLTGQSSAPAGSNGLLATLSFTANASASGTANIGVANIIVLDPSANTIQGVISTNGSVTIGSGSNSQSPTITSFTPTSGGSGTSVTISGTNFTGATAVEFGTTSAQSYTVNSATGITAVVPNLGTSNTTIAIQVATAGGTATASSNFSYTVSSSQSTTTTSTTSSLQLPTITTFTPTSGGSGTSVTISGTDFTGATTVQFGTTNAQSYTVNSASGITAVVPNLGTSNTTVAIKVTTSGGTATASSNFSYTVTSAQSTTITSTASSSQLPTITSFTPTSGESGTSVTISGTNFTGATAVEFGTASAQIYTVNSAAGITVVVPNLGAGNTAVAITVTTTVGMAISTSDFSYYASLPDTTTNSVPSSLPAPIISSFTPTSGNTGTAITIQGSNLSGATGVQFGGTNATNFIIDSGSEITAIVGSGSSGSVKVTTPTGVASITGFTFGTVSDNTSGTLTQDNGGVTVLDISDVTDDGGVLQKDFQYGGIPFSGANQIVSLTIAQGTRVISNEGTPVTQMTVQAANDVPPAPTGKTIISAFELGPSGTTFSEPITFLLEYDQNLVPKGTGASGLSLDCYNPQTGQWVKCDYSLDIASHQIKANISHFSLYAVIGSGSSGLMGVGWDLAGIIIISELLVGGVIVYWLLQRKPNKAVIATASVASSLDSSYDTLTGQNVTKGEFVPVSWDDMINQNLKEQNNKGKFKTSVTVMGGKIIIPQQGDLGGIELVNEPNSKIVISLEYDPALSPIGKVTINVLGKESEYEKLKEKRA